MKKTDSLMYPLRAITETDFLKPDLKRKTPFKNVVIVCNRLYKRWVILTARLTLFQTSPCFYVCYGRPPLRAWLLPDLNTIPDNCVKENAP